VLRKLRAPLLGGVGEQRLGGGAEEPVLGETRARVVDRGAVLGGSLLGVDRSVGEQPARLQREQPRGQGEEVGEVTGVDVGLLDAGP